MTLEDNLILLFCSRLLVGLFIGSKKFKLYDTLDWEDECDRFIKKNFSYSEYYSSKNFHGISGRYLNPIAAVTYDGITRFATPPNEIKLHQKAIAKIIKKP